MLGTLVPGPTGRLTFRYAENPVGHGRGAAPTLAVRSARRLA